MRPIGSAAVLQERRRRAVGLLEEGNTPTQVAQMLGVARQQTVQRWKATVRDHGKKGLKSVPQYVKTCRLNAQQQRELGRIITGGAMAAGFSTELWTTARVTEVIWKRFRVRYNHDHVGRILHALGHCWQKPVKRARSMMTTLSISCKREWPCIKNWPKTKSWLSFY